MAIIKALKFRDGIPSELNPSVDSLAAKSFVFGGAAGTELTKAILDTLIGGPSSDASSLHNHDSRYYRKDQHIDQSNGAGDAAKPVITNSNGKVDPSFINQSAISHGSLSGLTADDHTQYHNDTRGDARYFRKDQHVNTSAGAADAGKPVVLDAGGKIAGSMIDSSDVNHEQVSGLQGGAAGEHYHLTQNEHDKLTGGSATDASTMHNHDTQYFTKVQSQAALDQKANDNAVIKKDGSVAFTDDQSMGSNKLTNLADPEFGADAVNLSTMEAADALKVSKAGDSMSGTLNMTGNKVANVADPVDPTDAANKRYVDQVALGLAPKNPVRVASNGPVDLLDLGVVDGIQLVAGDRVLVKDQALAKDNGIYVAAEGPWVRAEDFNSSAEAKPNSSVWVEEGFTQGDNQFVLTTDAPITLGTTPLTWTKFGGAAQIVAGVGLDKVGDTISVNLGAGIKELPSDEVGLDLYVAGALDLVDPSTGMPSAGNDGQLSVKVDGDTLEISTSGIKVRASGITENEIASSIAGPGLAGGSGAPLEVVPGDGIEIDSDAVKVRVSDFAGDGLEDDGDNNLRLSSNAAGDGLTYNSGSLNVNTDGSTIEVAGDVVQVRAGGISRNELATQAVGSQQIEFGTGLDQVGAQDIPVAPVQNFEATYVDDALVEIAAAAYREVFTAGETIGQNDLVAIRRDPSGNARAYKASSASNDNYVSATKAIQDLTYTAVTPSGNHISIVYNDPQVVNASLAITVIDAKIIVSLATDGTGAITTTAAQIASAIAANPGAAALVTTATSGSASQIQLATPETFLTGGKDFNDNGRWEVIGMAVASATSGANVTVKKLGKLSCPFVTPPTSKDIGKTVYLSTNQGQAQLAAPTATNTGVVVLGRLVSLSEVEFRAAVLRYVNG